MGSDTDSWMNEVEHFHERMFRLWWLLLANVCYLNIMIAISGEIFSENKEEWAQGDLSIKNEFVVQCEKLFFWRRYQAHGLHHLVFIEEDTIQDDDPLDEKFDNIKDKVSDLQKHCASLLNKQQEHLDKQNKLFRKL